MLVALVQRGAQARLIGTTGIVIAPPVVVPETRSSNPMLAYVGRMMTRCIPFLVILLG